MTFYEYQKAASATAIYPNRFNNIAYTALGLAGEAGEVANKVKKIQRDSGGLISKEMRAAISKELGDALWYISATCDELGVSLESVASENIEKLKGRQQAQTISGEGDSR